MDYINYAYLYFFYIYTIYIFGVTFKKQSFAKQSAKISNSSDHSASYIGIIIIWSLLIILILHLLYLSRNIALY